MNVRDEAINRVLKILGRFSRRLRISLCLPMLLNCQKFADIFVDHSIEFKKLRKLCMSDWTDHQNVIEGCSSKDASLQPIAIIQDKLLRIESQWAVILEGLSQYEDEILSIINDDLEEIPPNYSNIINHVELLKQIVEWQMRTTPKQLRERKLELREAEALIVCTQEEIEHLEGNFNEETLKYNEIVEKSREEINNLNLVIDEIKRQRREKLDTEMNCYKTTARGLRDDIAEEENNLVNQLEAHKEMLDKLIQANLEQEKTLREHCIQVERKCLRARNTYDRDLGKLNELKTTLEVQLCVTNNHYELLKNEYDVQSVLYANLKKERELAMMQAFAEQLDNFEKNRAARIIQRTWRAYHERVSAKKKKRTRRNK